MNKTIHGYFKITSFKYGEFLRDAKIMGVDLSHAIVYTHSKSLTFETEVEEEAASLLILKYGPDVCVYEKEEDEDESTIDEEIQDALNDLNKNIDSVKKKVEKTNKLLKYLMSGW